MGQFTPKSEIHILSLTCSAIHPSSLFWCELPSPGDIGRRDVCFLSNTMELDGTQLVVLNAPKLQIIHRPCQTFHIGSIFFLPNYTRKPSHRRRRKHLLMVGMDSVLWAKQAECHLVPFYSKDISTAEISKTQQLTPKRSRWTNNTTGKRQNM